LKLRQLCQQIIFMVFWACSPPSKTECC
jgi:hypothetical protein